MSTHKLLLAGIVSDVNFTLRLEPEHHWPLLDKVYSIFLFIAPISIIQCNPHSVTINGWGENGQSPYYWSLHPDGSHPLSPRHCEVLKLPKFEPKLQICMARNLHYFHYEAARQIQSTPGFWSHMQEYACSTGFPLLEPVQRVEIVSPEKGV